MGVFLALALVVAYVESLIPISFGIPGVKIGLTNIVILLVLYCLGTKEAFIISALRAVLAGFLFGNMFGIIYSLAGAMLSLFCMYLFKRVFNFRMITVSVIGGITHNLGQIIIASLVVENYHVMYYFPVLVLSGVVTGIIIGMVAFEIYKRIGRLFLRVDPDNNDENRKKVLQHKLRYDIIAIIVMILLSVILVFVFLPAFSKDGDKFKILVDGEVYGEYPLDKDNSYEVEIGGTVSNVVTVKDGQVYMSEADCPDKICVSHRPISKKNESIICLPNKVVVEVVTGEDSGLDTIAR